MGLPKPAGIPSSADISGDGYRRISGGDLLNTGLEILPSNTVVLAHLRLNQGGKIFENKLSRAGGSGDSPAVYLARRDPEREVSEFSTKP